MRDFATLTGIEYDEIADLVRRIGEYEYAGKQIGQGILGGETDRDADDTGRRQPGGHVDFPGGKYDINSEYDDRDIGQV